jgi:hypothetical protein
MNPLAFEQIRQSVGAKEAAAYYGVEIKKGMASCPFHEDRHPSMSFKNGRFKCFSCGAGGTAIDLVMQMFGLTAADAAKKINADFNLGLDLDRPAETKEMARRKRDDELYQAFHKWEHGAFLAVTNYLDRLRADIAVYAPKTPEEPLDERYMRALHRIDYIGYLADVLTFGELTEKIELYKAYGKKVLQLGKTGRTGTTEKRA